MVDREKVTNGLEHCKDIHRAGRWAQGCAFCGYADKHQPDCFLSLADDALALLEEQPEVIRCKDCKHLEHLAWMDEKNEKECYVCRKHSFTGMRSPAWFCADGERRDEND